MIVLCLLACVVACCFLPDVRLTLFVAHCLLFVVRCLLLVVRVMVFVGLLLFVVCGVLF